MSQDETVFHIHKLPLWTSRWHVSIIIGCFFDYNLRNIALYPSLMIYSSSFSLIVNILCLHHACIVTTAFGLSAIKKSSNIGWFQFVLPAQSVEMDKRPLSTHWSSKNVLKPVRKFLKELKREVLWTMLRFPYCSFMEPALKQCLDPLTLPVNPSAQSNGHLKQQHLLLTVWLLWCKAFKAKPFPGMFWVHKRSIISTNSVFVIYFH